MHPLELIKREIRDLPWKKLKPLPFPIRQSTLRTWDECRYKCHLDVVRNAQSVKPYYFLLGSIMHFIFELKLRGVAVAPYMIASQSKKLRAEESYAISMTDEEIGHRFFEKIYFGFSLEEIASKVLLRIISSGYAIQAIEKKITAKIGNINFEMTIDLLAIRGRENIIADFKTGGMWDRFIGMDKSVTAQSYHDEQITHSGQFVHYDWLLNRLTGRKADTYAYILPANGIPVSQGKRKGEDRGRMVFEAPASTTEQLEAYEEDLLVKVQDMSYCNKHGRWTKDRPEYMGKNACNRCTYVSICLGKKQKLDVPDYLQNRDLETGELLS